MFNSNERMEERFNSLGMELERRTYNAIMCGIVLYGLIVNIIICHLIPDIFQYAPYPIVLIGYFVCAFIGIFMSKSTSPIISFIGYNFVVVPVGVVVSATVNNYGGLSSEIVSQAILYTGIVSGVMTVLAISQPTWFDELGNTLFMCLLGLIAAEIIILILGIDQIITAWIGAALFSLYIAYDVHRSQQFPATLDNAVDCALDIYLDLINLFLDILRILGSSKSSRKR